jgi:hypothetical protein
MRLISSEALRTPMASSAEYGNESSSSIGGGECLYWLREYQFFKNGYAS